MDNLNLTKYFVNEDLSSDSTGATGSARDMNNLSYTALFSGAPNGSIVVEASNDGKFFITFSATAIAAPGPFSQTFIDFPFAFIRVRWVFTSGSGTIDLQLFGKGFI